VTAGVLSVKTLQIILKGQKGPISAQCDRYEVKDAGTRGFVDEWLILYRGDKETGRYKLTEVVAYHEEEEREISF
jgi:hypothetical protein